MLTIEHTEAEGTLLQGSSRGDGTAEVVKALGWRWGRSIGRWFVPRSREQLPRRELIERTAQALRGAGHEVRVEVDATPGDRVEREARMASRAQERAQRLAERADREEAESESRRGRAEQISSGIPFGQPVLLGHHSQRRHERDAERIRANMGASIEHAERAEEARRASRVAAAATGARHSQVTVGNRIERLGAQIRRTERTLGVHPVLEGQDPSAWQRRLMESLEADRADLAYWEQVRQEQITAGGFTDYGQHNVAAGDTVLIRGTWRRVARANKKSVSVETGYSWTDRAPWHEVRDHRRAEDLR